MVLDHIDAGKFCSRFKDSFGSTDFPNIWSAISKFFMFDKQQFYLVVGSSNSSPEISCVFGSDNGHAENHT